MYLWLALDAHPFASVPRGLAPYAYAPLPGYWHIFRASIVIKNMRRVRFGYLLLYFPDNLQLVSVSLRQRWEPWGGGLGKPIRNVTWASLWLNRWQKGTVVVPKVRDKSPCKWGDCICVPEPYLHGGRWTWDVSGNLLRGVVQRIW